MSNRYKGGVISATPPTTTGGEDGTASGAWTLEQQMQLQAAGLWPAQPTGPYIEQVFSTYLYTGTGAAQTINNGINLSGKGGLVWLKNRTSDLGALDHYLEDTARGTNKYLSSNTTNQQQDDSAYGGSVTSFNSTGFSLGTATSINYVGSPAATYVSWTFRKQPKFFDIVTYTGDGTTGKVINHSLGSEPGCIIVKLTSSAGSDWQVWHRNDGTTAKVGYLNLTSSMGNADYSSSPNLTFLRFAPTATNFTLKASTQADANACNASGQTYVAYLFAHNAGGFGLTGTDNVISCGSFTTNGSGAASVTLGYEPQWILYKPANAVSDWGVVDSMRGMPVTSGSAARLYPNASYAEGIGNSCMPNATGFTTALLTSTDYIYIAIRRGPMKVPTSGTSVFNTITRTGTDATVTVSGVGFSPDLVIGSGRSNATGKTPFDKLRGAKQYLDTTVTDAEGTDATSLTGFTNNGYTAGADNGSVNTINFGIPLVSWNFRRAPSFFDEVCYTGNSVQGRTITHNLGVKPELMIVKSRSNTPAWYIYNAGSTATQYMLLNSSQSSNAASFPWNDTEPTSSVFTVQGTGGTGLEVNWTGYTYVAYLFATCPGVSKVGSYTGTGTAQTINCGFTAGSRFVLIKRTDSTGGWQVWDSARGIIPANDPYLLLNSTAVEVTGTDYIDTTNVGFDITSTAPDAINASGGTYIFLAIA
jgi:hypothetical protein